MSNTETEKRAKKHLEQLGWEPKRCRVSSYPDFECSDNRYVEVKRIQGLDMNTNIPKKSIFIKGNQLKAVQSLTVQNSNKVYILVYDNDYSLVGMFEIKAVDL